MKKDHPDENSTIAIGVDGVLGLDYKISGAPINVSLDWQPSSTLLVITASKQAGAVLVYDTFLNEQSYKATALVVAFGFISIPSQNILIPAVVL